MVIQNVRASLEAQIWCSEHVLHFQNITPEVSCHFKAMFGFTQSVLWYF